jgi:hypothetical protein
MEKLFLSAILLSLSFYLPAGVLETARTAKGFQEIICSSNGNAGGLSPGKALAGLRKGMTFKLLPGDYDSEILITHDKVIITGDPTKPCDVELVIHGKGCIVRNIWLRKLRAADSITVVDSFIDRFYSQVKRRGKVKNYFYNTCLGAIRSSWRDTAFILDHCTIVGNDPMPPIRVDAFSKWTILNSILFSNTFLFGIDIDGHKKGKVGLKNNLVYGEAGLGKILFTRDIRKGRAQALNIKELKKIVKVTASKNIMEKSIFVKPLKFRKVVNDGHRQNDSSYYINYLKPANFQLTPDSPGQDKGIIIPEHPSFQKKNIIPKNKPKKKENTPREEQKKKDDWDDAWKRIEEEAKKKKDKPKPPPPLPDDDDKNDDELGGVPDQPK